MKLRIGVATSAILVGLLGGCGSSEEGEPLLSGSLTASYADEPFTPEFGFATTYNGSGLIGLGAGPIHCGTEQAPAPPSGDNVVIVVPLEVGVHGSVLVQVLHNDGGNYHSFGTNSGSVEITSVTSDAVAGSVGFDATDDAGKHYAVAGTFEVLHCAP